MVWWGCSLAEIIAELLEPVQPLQPLLEKPSCFFRPKSGNVCFAIVTADNESDYYLLDRMFTALAYHIAHLLDLVTEKATLGAIYENIYCRLYNLCFEIFHDLLNMN